jgi:peptidoglycan hydrolase CwlO-like protein
VLTAVAATVALMALAAGGYALYHNQTTEISHLKNQRQNLQATNTALSSQLTTMRGKLRRANLKPTNTTKGLLLAKRNLTKLRKDVAAANERADNVAAANERADANYSAGYSTGNDQGYSSGRSAGLVAGSDSLLCSDDPDVTWLPYCN